MRTAYLGDFLHLQSKKNLIFKSFIFKINTFKNTDFSLRFLIFLFIIFYFLCNFSQKSHAQRKNKYWFERGNSPSFYAQDADPKLKTSNRILRPLHFGMFFGATFSGFRVGLQDAFIQNTDPTQYGGIVSVVPKNSAGLIIGAYSNLKISDFWDFRFCVNGFAGYERSLEYTFANGEKKSKVVEASMFELPILFKYRSQLRGTRGLYLIGGIKPSFLLTSRKNDAKNITVKTQDFSIEYGFGLEIFYPYFKFAPELRFSHGFNNMLNDAEQNEFNTPLKSLTTHSAILILHFGG
jgi:hypothetical protein